MNRIATGLVLAGTLLAAAPAGASLTVTPGLTVHNKCHRDLAIAVRYKDSRGFWATSAFTNVQARQRRDRVVSSNNRVFYYYAESSSGTRWSGNHNVRVDGKIYAMKETRLNLDRGRNSFTLGLICTT